MEWLADISLIWWVVVIVINVPIAWILWKCFFDSREEFFECVRFYFTPDIISMFRGEFWDDYWGSAKLGIWFFLCAGSVLACAGLLAKLLG